MLAPTNIHCRKCSHVSLCFGTNANPLFSLASRFFPPSTELSSGQEKAQQKIAEEQTAEAQAKASQLPDVPTTDPATAGHAQKKQKQDE